MIILTLALVFLGGCASIKEALNKEMEAADARIAKRAEDAEKNRLTQKRASHYMEVIPSIETDKVKGIKLRYMRVRTPGKYGHAFVCAPQIEASSINQVEVAYWTIPNPWLRGATKSIRVNNKFKYLDTRAGKPFNHKALRDLKKACLADSEALKGKQVAANKRKLAEEKAIKNKPKIAAKIKQELMRITGKKNITTYHSSRNLLEIEALIKAGKIKKDTYIKLVCKGQCSINQYQVSQPTNYGYLLSHKSLGAKKWERGQGLPYLLTSKTNIFKGENIESKVKYIQYTGLGSYLSLSGNRQAIKIKEVK